MLYVTVVCGDCNYKIILKSESVCLVVLNSYELLYTFEPAGKCNAHFSDGSHSKVPAHFPVNMLLLTW